MSIFTQVSFASGEMSPQTRQRNELAQVYSGMSYSNNFIVTQTGNIVNRGGFQYLAKTVEYSKQMVFNFGFGQVYILEFRDKKMYVLRNDSYVLKSDDLSIVSQTGNTYTTAQDYTQIIKNADLVYGSDGQYYFVKELVGETLKLVDIHTGNEIVKPPTEPLTKITPVYYIVTDYDNSHLDSLLYVQSADTIIVTSEHYKPKNIIRKGHDNWEIKDVSYSPTVTPPSDGSNTKYIITVVSKETGEESKSFKANSATKVDEVDGAQVVDYYDVNFNQKTDGDYEYNVYRYENGIAGFIGISGDGSFRDENIKPDFKQSPPELRNYFENNNPFTAVYHKQRTIYGGSVNEPQSFYGSKVGDYNNFNKSFPIRDDDPFKFELNSEKSQRIRHLISMRGIFAFTDSSVWFISGDNNGVIKPTLVNAEEQVVRSTSKVKPLRIGRDILFLLEGGRDVQYLAYNYEINGFDVKSLTTFASHLFEDEYIIDWAYAEKPFGIITCVTNKGNAFVLTYYKEQEVIAWSRMETNGKMLSVISVPEDNEDYLIFKVKRATGVFLEKMNNRHFKYYYDGKFLDSHSCVDNYKDETLSLTPKATNKNEQWKTTDTITAVSTNDIFKSSDVGSEISIRDDNDIVILKVTKFIDNKTVETQPNLIVPDSLRVAHRWGWAIKKIKGLSYLEGQEVSVLYDYGQGNTYKVQNGSITLLESSAFVCIGLPYVATMRNIDVNSPQRNLMSKDKIVKSIFLSYIKTFGISVGVAGEKKEDQSSKEKVKLYTETKKFTVRSSHKKSSIIEVVQDKPFPVNITSVALEVEMSDVD